MVPAILAQARRTAIFVTMTPTRSEPMALITVPNVITVARLCAVPLLAWLMLNGFWVAAFWLFIIAGLSDAADGFIARWFDQRSALGAWMDPVADKALLVTAFVILAMTGAIPIWLVVLAVVRDVLILVGVGFAQLSGKALAIRPMMVSKATTACQIALVAVVMAALAYGLALEGWRDLFVWLTAALTAASFATYGVVFVRHMGAGGYSR